MEITSNTKLSDILAKYPRLMDEAVNISPKFKLLKTPMGKIMLKKATVKDISSRSGIPEREIIEKINELIASYGSREKT